MNIKHYGFLAGAKQARGLAVVIDVFRATTVVSYLFAQGAQRIYPVATVDKALLLRDVMRDVVLVGERGGKKIEGFDLGNSPTEVMKQRLDSKIVVHTTTNGTLGLVSTNLAQQRLVASFVNISATVDYIKRLNPTVVSLIAANSVSGNKCEEDTLCARAIEDMLRGKAPHWSDIHNRIKHSRTGRKFFDPDICWAPKSDFEYALSFDRFNNPVSALFDKTGRLFLDQVGL